MLVPQGLWLLLLLSLSFSWGWLFLFLSRRLTETLLGQSGPVLLLLLLLLLSFLACSFGWLVVWLVYKNVRLLSSLLSSSCAEKIIW